MRAIAGEEVSEGMVNTCSCLMGEELFRETLVSARQASGRGPRLLRVTRPAGRASGLNCDYRVRIKIIAFCVVTAPAFMPVYFWLCNPQGLGEVALLRRWEGVRG
jgi:hypothetical protein